MSKKAGCEPFSSKAVFIVGIPVPLPSVNWSSLRNSPIRPFLYLLEITLQSSKSACFSDGSIPL